MAKDVILHVHRRNRFSTARPYRAMQWGRPPARANLTMDDRMTIANMAIEAGGKNGNLRGGPRRRSISSNARCAANGTKADYTPAEAGPNQKFVYEQGVSTCRRWSRPWPCTPTRANRALAKDARAHRARPRLHRQFAPAAKTSDFLAFAEVVKGKKVKTGHLRGAPRRRAWSTTCTRSSSTASARGRVLENAGRAHDRKRQLRRLPGRGRWTRSGA